MHKLLNGQMRELTQTWEYISMKLKLGYEAVPLITASILCLKKTWG